MSDARRQECRRSAFTIIELLIVMAIIIVLAGLIIGTSGYVQKKGARSRAEAEIAAMSAALENYKADNGIYPQDDATNALEPTKHFNPDKTRGGDAEYFAAGSSLYKALAGSDETQNPIHGAKSYLPLKPQMVDKAPGSGAAFVRDPFGNAYGYSTAKAATPNANVGYNPTFDLWSTADQTTSGGVNQWIKNW